MTFTVTNTFLNGTTAEADEVNTNFTDVGTAINGFSAAGTPATIGISPIGSITAWHKTFNLVDSGTADTNTLNALEDTAADFVTDGVTAGMVVYNSDDETFAIADVVTATKITLKADANSGSATVDIFPLGSEAYSIYATPELPDNWYECNGQVLSDADSVYNGTTLPDLNALVEETYGYFLRGSDTGLTGATEGSQNKAHTHTFPLKASAGASSIAQDGDGGSGTGTTASSGGTEARPASFVIVWIMRIK